MRWKGREATLHFNFVKSSQTGLGLNYGMPNIEDELISHVFVRWVSSTQQPPGHPAGCTCFVMGHK